MNNKYIPKKIKQSPKKDRECLGCGNTFKSFGIMNRICSTCRDMARFRGSND